MTSPLSFYPASPQPSGSLGKSKLVLNQVIWCFTYVMKMGMQKMKQVLVMNFVDVIGLLHWNTFMRCTEMLLLAMFILQSILCEVL